MMTSFPQQQIHNLIQDVSRDLKCEEITPPLINQFALHEKIPNRWFDWENRANSKVMIIGQDWGPYIHLKKYIDDPSHDHFASSRTEKFIINTLASIDCSLIDEVYFTVAVIFTRTGHLFRGNQNFNERQSFEISFPYVSRQIDIVRPEIILTLGGLAFQAVDRHFKFGNGNKKLSEIVAVGELKKAQTTVIPAYHPAAFIAPSIQLQAWGKFRNFLKEMSHP